MAIHFVSTSILSSSDGISFGDEKQVDSEEVKRARLQAERGTAKSLYEQLSEKEAKKQEEFDANAKLLRAPPKALDAEDIEFFNQLERSKEKESEQRVAEERELLKEFRSHKHGHDIEVNLLRPAVFAAPEKRKEEESIAPIIVKKRKLKKDDAINTKNEFSDGTENKASEDHPKASAPLEGLLTGYGSDSD